MTHHYINHEGGVYKPEQEMDADFPLEHVSIEPEQPTDQPPVVVLLHGRGATERDLIPLAEELPDTVHVLSFRAPNPLGPGYTWYDLDLSGGGLHASQPDEHDFDRAQTALAASIDQAVEAYNLDPDRVGLLGFSQGAILSLGSLIDQPGAYQWIVALHGYLPGRYEAGDLERATNTPVFIGAGTKDEIIPATRAEDAADRLKAAGHTVLFRTYPIGHGTSAEEIADVKEWLDSHTDLAD